MHVSHQPCTVRDKISNQKDQKNSQECQAQHVPGLDCNAAIQYLILDSDTCACMFPCVGQSQRQPACYRCGTAPVSCMSKGTCCSYGVKLVSVLSLTDDRKAVATACSRNLAVLKDWRLVSLCLVWIHTIILQPLLSTAGF